MMNAVEFDKRDFLQEFQEQPEEVRQLFIYAICQTMIQAGMLEFKGAFSDPVLGVTLLYRNPDTGDVFEIVKPALSEEEEQAMRAHIGELLQESARAV